MVDYEHMTVAKCPVMLKTSPVTFGDISFPTDIFEGDGNQIPKKGHQS